MAIAVIQSRRTSTEASAASLGKSPGETTRTTWTHAVESAFEINQCRDEFRHPKRRLIMMNTTYGKLTTGLIAVWFAFSLFASASHWFRTESGQPPLPLLLAVLVPIGAFLLWYRNSKSFREFVLSLSPRTLTVVHAWRMAGFRFLALYAYGILPGYFALPAGWGDVAIGATAIMA